MRTSDNNIAQPPSSKLQARWDAGRWPFGWAPMQQEMKLELMELSTRTGTDRVVSNKRSAVSIACVHDRPSSHAPRRIDFNS